MKSYRKKTVGIGLFITILALSGLLSVQNSYAQITVSMDDIGVATGQSVSVPVNLANVAASGGFSAFQFEVVPGDPAIQFDGIDKTGTLVEFFTQVGAGTSAPFNVGGFTSSDQAASTDGVLIKLNFTITGPVSGASVTLEGFRFSLSGTVPHTPAVPSFLVGSSSPPVGVDDAYDVDEGGTLNVGAFDGVLANDTDPDFDLLSVQSVLLSTANGTLSVNTDGSFTYTHDGSETSVDFFTYLVTDGISTDEATAVITINPVSDPPVADAVQDSTPEETPVTITLTGSDVDGTIASFEISSNPVNGGQLSAVSGNQVTYTPALDFNGLDTFEFEVVDDSGLHSTPATVSVTVTPINDIPVANPISETVEQDAFVDITLDGTDVDDDPLTYQITSDPSNGNVSVSGAIATYTPDPGYFGTDSFSYVAKDGISFSLPATVTIEVIPTASTWVQFIHAGALGGGTVDFYLNGVLLRSGLAARAATESFRIPAGSSDIGVAPGSSSGPNDIVATLTIPGTEDVANTIVAGGNPLQVFSAEGPKTVSTVTVTDVRVVNASPFIPSLSVDDISDVDHSVLATVATGLSFGQYSTFVALPTASNPVHLFNTHDGSGKMGNVFETFRFDLTSVKDDIVHVVGMGDPEATGAAGYTMIGYDMAGNAITPVVVTANEEPGEIPNEFALRGNYPNPFNPSTTIQFDLPETARVNVVVLDLLGREVMHLDAGTLQAGSRQDIAVDASALPSGIYLYRIIAESQAEVRAATGSMTLLK